MEPVAPPWPPDRRWPGWPPELHHHEIAPLGWNWAAPAAPNVTVGWINHGYFPYTNSGVLVAPSAVNFGRQEPSQIDLEAHQQASNQYWHKTEEAEGDKKVNGRREERNGDCPAPLALNCQ